MSEQTQVTGSPASPGGGNRMLIMGGMVALAIVAVAVVGAIFLLPRLFGADENAIAGVMPAETSLLVELNALNLANEDTNRIARAFEDVLNQSDVAFDANEPTSLLEQMDRDLEEASGLTITDDVLPWIGPNMGVGLIELDIEAIDQGAVPQVIFATTIRDTALADQFIEDLIDAIEDGTGNDVDDRDYNGVILYEVDSDFEDERLAFGRSDNIFFIAANLDTLENAIDAQQGENLGKVSEYQNTIARLPGDRALTFYIRGAALADSFQGVEDTGGLDGIDPNVIEDLGILGVGMSAMVASEGIRLDIVSKYESLSNEQQALLDAQSDDLATAEFLPESTYVFLAAQRLDLAWQSALRSLDRAGVSEEDMAEAMEMFDDTFGFNPSADLFPLLNGEYSLAIIDSDQGLIAEELEIDLGAVFMAGSSSGEELVKLVEDFTNGLEDQNLRVEDSANDNVTVYEVDDPGGQTIGAYGLSEEYLIFASSGESIESLFAGESTLADSEKYQNAWEPFPRGTIPVMYIDLDSLFAALEDVDPTMEEVVNVNPVYAFAMGTNSDDNTTQTTMIFFVAGE